MSLSRFNNTIEKITAFLREKTFLALTSDMIFKAFLEDQEDLIIFLLTEFLPLPKGTTIFRADVLNPEIYPS